MKMEIKRISRNDIDVLSKVEYENMVEMIGQGLSLEKIKQEIANRIDNAWKIEDNDKNILGFYYWEKDEDASVLVSIQVRENDRNKGYGTLMLKHWESEALKNQLFKLGLAVHTNNPAYSWYTRQGFEYCGDDGPDCHMMIKEIREINK